MYLLYIDASDQKDYIFKVLLRDVPFQNYYFIEMEHATESFLKRCCSSAQGNPECVLVFSSNQYKKILDIVSIIKPKVIFDLSNNNNNNNAIETIHANLVLSHNVQLNKSTILYPLPLGFTTGTSQMNSNTTACMNRKYIWSFYGKNDNEIINTFILKFGHLSYYFNDKNVMFNNIIFAPMNNENITHLHEACANGAIPVLVNNSDHYRVNMYSKSFRAPFIFAKSWPNAVEKCAKLMCQPEQLEQMSVMCQAWFHTINESIKAKIHDALKII